MRRSHVVEKGLLFPEYGQSPSCAPSVQFLSLVTVTATFLDIVVFCTFGCLLAIVVVDVGGVGGGVVGGRSTTTKKIQQN